MEIQEALRNTLRRMMVNVYVRAFATATGRSFSDVGPDEFQAIAERFADVIEVDLDLAWEIHLQLLGAQLPPKADDEPEVLLVLDSEAAG